MELISIMHYIHIQYTFFFRILRIFLSRLAGEYPTVQRLWFETSLYARIDFVCEFLPWKFQSHTFRPDCFRNKYRVSNTNTNF